jgi:hypothetical protein
MYSLDTFTPTLLRCVRCGHALTVVLDPWDDPESLRMLTEDEAAAYWPDLVADLRRHGMTCPARGSVGRKRSGRRWRRRGRAGGRPPQVSTSTPGARPCRLWRAEGT